MGTKELESNINTPDLASAVGFAGAGALNGRRLGDVGAAITARHVLRSRATDVAEEAIPDMYNEILKARGLDPTRHQVSVGGVRGAAHLSAAVRRTNAWREAINNTLARHGVSRRDLSGLDSISMFPRKPTSPFIIAHEAGHIAATPAARAWRRVAAPVRRPLSGLAGLLGGVGLAASDRPNAQGDYSWKTPVGFGIAALHPAATFAEEARANYHAVKSLKRLGMKVPKGLIATQMANYSMLGGGVAGAALGLHLYRRRFNKKNNATQP